LFDFGSDSLPAYCPSEASSYNAAGHLSLFAIVKRTFDIGMSILLLPLLVCICVIIQMLNPFMNNGSLFFAQVRMGRGCKAFVAYKFRTMSEVGRITRGAEDPLEIGRITRLGYWLRKSRIDELPQILNVLKGEMSLIGPRPDYFHHARKYIKHVPGYRERHAVRPGISGLAQTEVGYVHGMEATAAKVRADIYYINNSCLKLDTWIFWRTVMTVLGHKGA
jgi:lipopolysaccharide/colanic/teichoic acid biosynthesis glycosyltransferase